MAEMKADDYLQLGLAYIQEKNLSEAIGCFRRAMEVYGENPPAELLSYYGYCLATLEGRIAEGLNFCQRALRMEMNRADFFLNIGRVELKGGQKSRAVQAFMRGMRIDKHNRQIVEQMRALGFRSRPVLPFFPRSHPINKFLGRLRYRLKFGRKPSRI